MSKNERTGPPAFLPFAEAVAVLTLGGLSVENGTDRIALHGSLDLTRDRRGLDRARELRSLIEAIVTTLEAQDLPDKVADQACPEQAVSNPFA